MRENKEEYIFNKSGIWKGSEILLAALCSGITSGELWG